MLKEYWDLFREWVKNTLRSRIFWLGIVCTLFLAVLVVRLFQLQILDGAAYYDSYVSRTKKEITTTATRGTIYDRNGVVLAGNEAVYNLTVKDTSEYTKANGDFNEMLLRLIEIVKKYDGTIVTELPVIIDDDGQFVYSGKDSAIRQLIRDVYGTSYIEEKSKEGEDVYTYDAETVMKRLMKVSYNFTTRWENAETISKEDALAICNIRYAMRLTTYAKYKSTTICSDISPELQAAILENQQQLLGVEVEQSERRVYPDGVYFSNILGYTGKPSTQELETLQESDSTYEATDMVGKDGLEQYYESELAGTKGNDTVYLNNVGQILDTIDSEPSVRGNDVYLTIDHDLQVAVYHIVEQRLADVLVGKLTIEDFEADDSTLASEFQISVKDVYYQMFNNNILDEKHFSDDGASEAEKQILSLYEGESTLAIRHILEEMVPGATIQSELTEDMQDYMEYVYTFLREKGVITASEIDTSDETFLAWKNTEISFYDFLSYVISKGWIDSSKLGAESAYSDSSQVMSQILSFCEENLSADSGFRKLVYKKLIHNEQLSGNLVCLALIDQGILDADNASYEELQNGDAQTAFTFIREKIGNTELTPAQIALDPCSGSAIVTDTTTGELLAMVSYPGYDLNKLSGTVDAEYWNKLINDQSEPLYDKATQVRIAPGSVYKLVTTSAGLEEGVIDSSEYINCIGTFDKLDHPRCWIARETGGEHGPLNTAGAIEQSCNFYFYEVGYRLSLNENGEYDAERGLAMLRKYAEKYGFGEKSGVEVAENLSQISTEYPATSAIGQGTNNMTAISLARYVTALATDGKLYTFRLLSKICDANGNVIEELTPEGEQIEGISQSTYDVMREGMYRVVHAAGTAAGAFTGLQIDIAGKSGSVQENLSRANHATFISYGPYNDPKISVTVAIPHGYMAYNAAVVCRYIYQYYFGYIDMEDILDKSYNTLGESATYSD